METVSRDISSFFLIFSPFREHSFFHGTRSLDPLDVRRDFSLSGGNLLAERVSRP